MREIKFRLHNHRDGKMYVFDPRWGNYYHGDGWVGSIPFEDETVTYAPSNRIQLEPESCDWMEFTGLLDKNSKEIYEGDIVKHPLCVKEPHDINEPCEVFVGRIQFEVDRGQYLAVNTQRNGYVIEMTEAYKFEVIGNIYHNPELLKQ